MQVVRMIPVKGKFISLNSNNFLEVVMIWDWRSMKQASIQNQQPMINSSLLLVSNYFKLNKILKNLLRPRLLALKRTLKSLSRLIKLLSAKRYWPWLSKVIKIKFKHKESLWWKSKIVVKKLLTQGSGTFARSSRMYLNPM